MPQPQPPIDPSLSPSDLTRRLCDIPSVSGEERIIADAIEPLVRRAPHLRVTRDGDTLIARTDLGRTHRVIIAGHLDTVPVNGNLPTHESRDAQTGDVMLWGRGTVDMKAGVAVQLKLALELTAPAVDVTWVWYDNEEVASEFNGLGRAQRNHPELFSGDFAMLGEPTNGVVEGGCNGTLRARITMFGQRAHSARAWMGVNAIERTASVLAQLEATEGARVTVDGLEFREGLHAVGISGGVAGNVIPDRCDVIVNYRFAPSASAAAAEAYIRDAFDRADEIEILDVAEGARPGLDAPLVQRFIAAVGAEPRAKQGWTDVARFSALGIPAVNFGPGDPLLAHTDDERVAVAQIDHVYTALRAWLSHAGTSADFRDAEN